MPETHSEDPRIPDHIVTRLHNAVEDARVLGETDPMLMCLASCGLDCKPSVRHILAADINEYGILFFANAQSGKGFQMKENPQVALTFYWHSTEQQAVIEGVANIVSDVEAQTVWHKRERSKQIVAWATSQSSDSRGEASMRDRMAEVRSNFEYERIPMPEQWRGYRVAPTRIEFWKAGWKNVRDRAAYELRDGEWQEHKYEP